MLSFVCVTVLCVRFVLEGVEDVKERNLADPERPVNATDVSMAFVCLVRLVWQAGSSVGFVGQALCYVQGMPSAAAGALEHLTGLHITAAWQLPAAITAAAMRHGQLIMSCHGAWHRAVPEAKPRPALLQNRLLLLHFVSLYVSVKLSCLLCCCYIVSS
jgi:hypothetical protein